MCDNSNAVDSDSDEGFLAGYSLPNLSRSDETSNMQQSSLTRSQYASVVFHGVSDTYPSDGDIVFKYSLTDGVEPSPGDRVVVFAVGWSSIKDYVVFDWAPMPKEGERKSSVVFKAEDLPKDTNEFYQVCYVSSEGSVFGASVPFQIRINNDELTFAIEEDMVVVRSSNDLAKEKLLKAQVDRENLNREKAELLNQFKVLKEKHEVKLREFETLEKILTIKNSYNEELRAENSRYREIECEMVEVKKEFEKMVESAKFDKMKIEDQTKALNVVNEDYKLIINNLKKSEKEAEDRLIKAIEQIETMRMSQEKLQNELEIRLKDSSEIDVIRMRNFSLENELTVCKFNLNNAQLENERLKNESDKLLKLNNELNDKLREVMEIEEIRKNYFEEHSSNGNFDKGKLITENTRLIKTSEELQYRISALEQEKLTLEQVLDETFEAQKKCDSSSSSSSKSNDNSIETKKSEEDLLNKIDEDSSSKFKQYKSSPNDIGLKRKLFPNHKSKGRTIRSTEINDKKLSNLKSDNYLLNERLKEQSYLLIKKDKEIYESKEIIKSMKKELEKLKIDFSQEISNLLSKNENLVREERNFQELRNEMQRITFMNEELLTENSGLMERLRKMESNKLSLREEEENIKESSLELENENLRKQLDTAYKNFDKTWKERGDSSLMLQKESSFSKSTISDEKINDSSIIFQITDERIDEMIRRGLEKQREQQSSSSLEPKLEEIFEKVDKVFSVVKKLSNDKENDIKNSPSSSSSSVASVVSENIQNYDVEELKERLSRARFEYEKLQGVMIVYKKKYEELKIKYHKSKIN